MSAVVDLIQDIWDSAWDAFQSALRSIWDELVEPLIEPIFGLFGIEDETIIDVERVSSKLFGTNTEDTVHAALVRSVLAQQAQDNDYFPHYIEQIYKVKAQVTSYYKYAANGSYINGFPDMRFTGTAGGFTDVQIALDDFTGSTTTVIKVTSNHPTKEQWFMFELQSSYSYHPWDNTLTEVDEYGASWDDWQMGVVTYNAGPDDYSIAISRTAEEAIFWIEGVNQITEGDTSVYTIKCNRTIPIGESIDINFTYAGTAVDGVDYTEVASVTMLELTSEVLVNIATAETANANRNFTITIGSLVNTNAAFEMVSIHTLDNVTTTITDDDTLRLTLNDVIVEEANTTITIAVKLEQAAPSGAFAVDYNFTDLGSITGGVDYDNTTGTLNFAGTVGEVQNINVDIYTDVADDDREQFEVFLENSTDVDSINTSIVSTVTILDGTSDPAVGTNTLNASITRPPYIDEASIIVEYSDDSDPVGYWWYWIYKLSAGTYPDIGLEVSEITGVEMLPLSILRKAHATIVDPELKSTRNLVRRIGYRVDDFIDAINTNPDIALIDDAYVNFSIGPQDTHSSVSKLLYLMWYEITVAQGLSSDVDEYNATLSTGDINNGIVWKTHVYTQDIAGVKTTTGEYFHDQPTPVANGGKASAGGNPLNMYYQKSDTHYDEIVVTYLNGMTAIDYNGHHQVALTTLGQDNFTFPVSWFIFDQLTPKEQLAIFQYLLRIDFYAIQITELEWYETSNFWDLFEFVLIVLAVISFFVDYTGSLAASIYAIAEAYVINYAIAEFIIWVAEKTGSEVLAAIAGIAAAIYLNDPKLFSTDTLLQAEMLLDLSTEFVGNLALIAGEEAAEIAAEIEEQTTAAQEKLDEELKSREDSNSIDLDSSFIAYIQSVDTSYFPAIQGQYEYNQLFNYDSLVGDYHEQQLKIGIQ